MENLTEKSAGYLFGRDAAVFTLLAAVWCSVEWKREFL